MEKNSEKTTILSLIPEEVRAQLKLEIIQEMEEEKRKKAEEKKTIDNILDDFPGVKKNS